MTRKSSKSKESVKRPQRKKLTSNRLMLILFAVIIALAFIFFSIYKPRSGKNTQKQPASSINKTPAFRLDGQVKIITAGATHTVDVEIADDDKERLQGLMYRYSIEENQGMFFIFPDEDFRSFWMKDTYISLDLIFINSNYEIVSIQKYTQPKSTYAQPSEKPAKYVLEVNAGFTDKYGIKPGDKVEF